MTTTTTPYFVAPVCKHDNGFSLQARHDKLDSGAYMINVAVICASCERPMKVINKDSITNQIQFEVWP